MDEKKAIIAALSLLVLALVGIIVVGSLIGTLQGVKGEDGKEGPRGPQGTFPSPVSGFLNQVQTQFTIVSSNLTQANAVVTLSANALLTANLNASGTYILATLSNVDFPTINTTGTAYLLAGSSQAPVTVNAQDGSVVLGPMPSTWNSGRSISLSATYMV